MKTKAKAFGLAFAVSLGLALAQGADAADLDAVLEACGRNSSSVQIFMNGLSEEQKRLFSGMYVAYRASVEGHREEGWGYGGKFQNARVVGWRRSIHESLAKWRLVLATDAPRAEAELRREIAQLDAEIPNVTGDERTAKIELRLQYFIWLGTPRGVCDDWAKASYDTLTQVQGNNSSPFEIEFTEVNRGNHAVTLVQYTKPNGRKACIAFDPWPRGLSELVDCAEFQIQKLDPFETSSCFSVNPPPH